MGDKEREWEISHSVAATTNPLTIISTKQPPPLQKHNHRQGPQPLLSETTPEHSCCLQRCVWKNRQSEQECMKFTIPLICHAKMHCKLLYMIGKELWRSNLKSSHIPQEWWLLSSKLKIIKRMKLLYVTVHTYLEKYKYSNMKAKRILQILLIYVGWKIQQVISFLFFNTSIFNIACPKSLPTMTEGKKVCAYVCAICFVAWTFIYEMPNEETDNQYAIVNKSIKEEG